MKLARLVQKKNRYRPLYKQFLRARTHIQNRDKVLRFKRKKWNLHIFFYLRRLRRYIKYKPIDQSKYKVCKFASKGKSSKKQFRDTLTAYRQLKLFYGNLSKKYIKKQITLMLKKKLNKLVYSKINLFFLRLFEHRLDTVLYRSKFGLSLRNSRQLIVHGKIFVNQKLIKIPSYILKPGDCISIDKNFEKLIINNFHKKKRRTWPIPPKHLTINYRTLEIIFNSYIQKTNVFLDFPSYLDLEKIILNYYRH